MAGYEIGISGLHAAQKALDIIGNNIANAATEGYHRQEVMLQPADEVYTNGQKVGQGVEITDIRRLFNHILEDEILRQTSSESDMEKRLEVLRVIENAFGELSNEGLSTAIDEFYASFKDLSLHPNDVNLQSSVLSAAKTLANQFRSLATVISDVEDMIFSEAVSTVDRVNILASEIAKLNKEVYEQMVRGHNANNIMDQRDKLVSELSQLIGIRTAIRDNGMVDITASDVSLVVGANITELEIGLETDGQNYQLGLRPKESDKYDTQLTGGVLGGLFKLKNELVSDIHMQFDLLAQTLISQTNQLHVQGVGSDGSFSMLSGWTMSEMDVSDMQPPVSAGQIHIRVTDPAGDIQRYTITVDSTSTLESVGADIAAIPGLDQNTSVNSGRLQIIANAGYSFDFLPGVLSEPNLTVPDPLAGAGGGAAEMPPTIAVSGSYTGLSDETYTVTVNTVPPGQTYAIGTGSMELEFRNTSGAVVKTMDIGQGYVAGTKLILENGISLCLQSNGASPGFFNDGEQFVIGAIADSDTSGFLAAVGINSFFSGVDASSIAVSDFISQDPSRIAVSKSADMNDNLNATAIGELGDDVQAILSGLSPKQFYRKLVVDLGNELSVSQMQHDNLQSVQRSLEQQRDEISGVDVNEQASLMMVYERMFQAMSRYISTINQTYDTIMSILQ